MSDKSYFKTDTIVRFDIKKLPNYQCVKTQKHSISIGLWLFICWKTKLKKKFFFEKMYVFFYKISKISIICRKNVFIWQKGFPLKNVFTVKNFFYTEKYQWKCNKINVSYEKYIFMQKMLVLQIKYKSFLNIYSFCKKTFFDYKKKNLLWTQLPGP